MTNTHSVVFWHKFYNNLARGRSFYRYNHSRDTVDLFKAELGWATDSFSSLVLGRGQWAVCTLSLCEWLEKAQKRHWAWTKRKPDCDFGSRGIRRKIKNNNYNNKPKPHVPLLSVFCLSCKNSLFVLPRIWWFEIFVSHLGLACTMETV